MLLILCHLKLKQLLFYLMSVFTITLSSGHRIKNIYLFSVIVWPEDSVSQMLWQQKMLIKKRKKEIRGGVGKIVMIALIC